jgi:hypothetical protein
LSEYKYELDPQSKVVTAKREGQNEVLELVKQGYTAEQIEAKLSTNRKGQITK